MLIPDDIKDKIEKLAEIKRFADQDYYPSDIALDNVKSHTIRMVEKVQNLPINNPLVVRQCWIHDIPEILASDTSVIKKFEEPAIVKTISEKEADAAKKLLSKDDLYLYYQFEIGKDFLNLESENPPELQESLLVRIVDAIDGNLWFHKHMPVWLETHDWDGNKPRPSAFQWTFIQNGRFQKALGHRDIDIKIRTIALELLRNQLANTKESWNPLPKEKVPEVMAAELGKL